ncbi:MAG: ATP-dependent DNA helicase RecG [Ruminococcus sp.]|nr:ATP-dependent DNA helicase RecG [Ruminococcus sp.]
MSSLFEIPIRALKGVGDKKAQLFHKLGIDSVGTLLYYFPRSYEDWSNPLSIADVEGGQVCCVKGKLSATMRESRLPGNRYMVRAEVSDGFDAMRIVFFNNKYITQMLKYDTEYLFYGKATKDFSGVQMVSPEFVLAKESADTFHPVYGLTAGLTNKAVQNAVKQAISMLPLKVADPLPDFILEKYDLCGLRDAIINIHIPDSPVSLQRAQRRLMVEELLVLSLGIRSLKQQHKEARGTNITADFTEEFLSLLPFTPTSAQRRAMEDCTRDMLSGKVPMNRLVQGDVGSGKTAIAACACYNMVKNGKQAAFMAPTEILAEQHFATLQKLFADTDIRVGLLTGSATTSNKKKIREALAQGEIDIIVGTHALITDKTVFKSLGLAVTDEQHRFGVAQRSKLLTKGDDPHLLVMSATPIPRTLALIIYGDLDISVVDEIPPGRQPIDTLLIGTDKRHRAFNFIRKELDNGYRAYIVCPLVEEDDSDLTAAEEYGAELMLEEFSDYAVGIIHGKMKYQDKEKTMRRFASGELQLLVATTVIEVGVDVPSATIMMIENAERFGLSQLHQLRGRVGRGDSKSYCILVSDNTSENTQKRLSVMTSTSDGFKIADEDLRLRGPGDFFGERQHGLPKLSIADFSDMSTLYTSQDIATDILEDSPDLSGDKYKGLRASIRRLFKDSQGTMN